jgi:hypothetical protein
MSRNPSRPPSPLKPTRLNGLTLDSTPGSAAMAATASPYAVSSAVPSTFPDAAVTANTRTSGCTAFAPYSSRRALTSASFGSREMKSGLIFTRRANQPNSTVTANVAITTAPAWRRENAIIRSGSVRSIRNAYTA